MTSSTRLALLLSIQIAASAAFAACGGDDAEPETKPDDPAPSTASDAGAQQPTGMTGSNTLQLSYSPMYSAFVEGGMHEAQVPVTLKDTSLRGKGAKFSSSDPSIAAVVDTAEGGLITIKKDGTVTIKAELDGETGSAKLTVRKYTEAQWMAGQARFSKSELAIVPAPGQAISLLALANPQAMRNANGACNTCHTAQAKTLKIENTPTQIAGYSDDELITIFTMGKKPENVAQKTMIPPFAWGMFHSWTVTEEEKQGLIAFLRTQAPKANPAMIDYGVRPCPGAPAPTAGMIPMLCDNDGKPVSIPGLPGQASGGADAGRPTSGASDAGASATADAGVAGDGG